MTTTIVLVRHGETVWHVENRYAGRTDIALTSLGLEQAERLAAWARSARLAAIWVSSLSRARATAVPVARETGLPIRTDQRLRELDFGRGEGLTVREMEILFPEALEAYRVDPVTNHLPDGEDPHQAVERALSCLWDIASIHANTRVLVVAHTTLIRLVLCHVVGAPIAHYRRLFPFIRNAAVTEVGLDAGRLSLLQLNAPLQPDSTRMSVDWQDEPMDFHPRAERRHDKD